MYTRGRAATPKGSVSTVRSYWRVTDVPMCCRDGGLKRAKVKDTFKEEQQKLYSKMLVGTQEDRSRSWGSRAQVDWSPHRLGHLWRPSQSAYFARSLDSRCRPAALHSASSVTASTPPACSLLVAVTGHSESTGLSWSHSTWSSACISMTAKRTLVKERRLPPGQSSDGKTLFYSLSDFLSLSYVLCFFFSHVYFKLF